MAQMSPVAPHDRSHEWNSHVRGAYIAVWLYDGHKLSTRDIMRKTGLSKQGVEFMLDILSGYMPIVRINRRWQWVRSEQRHDINSQA